MRHVTPLMCPAIMAKRHLTIKNFFQPKSPKLAIVDDDNGEDRQPSTMPTTYDELLLVIHSAREVRVDDVIHDFVSLNEQRQDGLGVGTQARSQKGGT